MRVTVLIPSYRRHQDLARCLAALRVQTRAPDSVLVVLRTDDEASRALVNEIASAWHSLEVVSVHRSGVVAAMNAGLENVPQVKGGVSLLSQGGCVVRYLANSASDMTRTNKNLWDAARELVVQLPRFNHRKY